MAIWAPSSPSKRYFFLYTEIEVQCAAVQGEQPQVLRACQVQRLQLQPKEDVRYPGYHPHAACEEVGRP